jgi:hypothetical protein
LRLEKEAAMPSLQALAEGKTTVRGNLGMRGCGPVWIWMLGALAGSTAIAQTVAPAVSGETGGLISQAGQVTLVGALACAVVVLWRTVTAKDTQLLEAQKTTTTALLTTAEAVKELKEAVERMEAAARK